MNTAPSSMRLLVRLRQPVPLAVPQRQYRNLNTLRKRSYATASEPPAQTKPSSFSPPPHPPASIPTPATPAAPATSPRSGPRLLATLGAPFRAYGRAQAHRPYVTQFVSTLVIYFLGDYAAQSLAPPVDEATGEPRAGRDVARTLRTLTIGGLASIPSYRWFLWLGHSFNYSSKTLSLATKVAVNQALFTPVFNSYFFGMQALLSGASLQETAERLRLTVPVSWLNSCKLWPAVTAISFTFVPPEYRSIFAGLVAVGWQTYLSFLNQRAAREERNLREKEHAQQSHLTLARAHVQA